MTSKNDRVAQIMEEWYSTMEKDNISVQPKASTILGTILAKHLNNGKEDVFDRYMNTKAGEFDTFWSTLTQQEKNYVESKRQKMRDKYYADRGLEDDQKKLLKG
tara:strand:+ start:423 stop:734 length:312 start_codon:yes stop_codon:yes gene_type:complete